MKKTVLFFLSFFVMALLILTSCEKEEETYLGSISVQLIQDDSYSDVPVSGVDVTIINTSDNIERTLATNSAGVVDFTEIPVGIYTVTASIEVTVSLTLNGVVQNVLLEPNEMKSVTLPLQESIASDNFVIKEVFFAGKADYDQKDRFFELFNNSSETLYADGLHFADLAGNTGSDANDEVLGLPLEEYCYATKVAKIPGTGTSYPVAPGESILIAFNAINFKEGFNPNNWAGLTIEDYLDLSDADFEMYAFPYLESKGFTGNAYFDVDNPSVPDVDILYMSNAGNNSFFRLNDYGPGLVIFRPEDGEIDLTNTIESPTSTPDNQIFYLKIPVKDIIDGVDILDNSSAGKFKRMNSRIDAGFAYLKADGNAFYSGMSLRRKLKATEGGRNILQDTNNSSEDFEVQERPTPRSY